MRLTSLDLVGIAAAVERLEKTITLEGGAR